MFLELGKFFQGMCYRVSSLAYAIWVHKNATIKKRVEGLLCQKYKYGYLDDITVVLYSRDRYEIIGLHKISHFTKQPCRNICLEKVL